MPFPSWLRDRQLSVCKRAHRSSPNARGIRPGLESLEGRVVLSTLTVTNTQDGGPGSLRAEIAIAKNNDTIVFDGTLYGSTITLTSGELALTKNVTIQGPSANLLTVSGGGNSRVFEIAAKSKVTLSGLTISNGGNAILASNGYGGGGVFNHGTLKVQGCTLTGNTAEVGGGIANDFGSTLTLAGCTVSDNSATLGGGVWNGGTLAVSSSVIGAKVDDNFGIILPGNTSYKGGGIYNLGSATISGGTLLSGNIATFGDLGSGYGGGIYNDGNAKLTISNCTLSGNSAGNLGGGIYNAGSLTVRNCAFSGNTPDSIFGPYTDGGGNTFG